jgi:Fe-S cluster assembly iron-binding protein IscA
MLVISPAASAAIASVLAQEEVPEGATFRLELGSESEEPRQGVEMTLVEEPEPDDQVVDTGAGADLFVEARTAEALEDQVLDADFEGDGVVFGLRPQSLNGHGPT